MHSTNIRDCQEFYFYLLRSLIDFCAKKVRSHASLAWKISKICNSCGINVSVRCMYDMALPEYYPVVCSAVLKNFESGRPLIKIAMHYDRVVGKNSVLSCVNLSQIVCEICEIVCHEGRHVHQMNQYHGDNFYEISYCKSTDSENRNYFSKCTEVDAYALSIAFAIKLSTVNKWHSILSSASRCENVSSNFRQYTDEFGRNHFIVKKLLKKIYKHCVNGSFPLLITK